MDMACRKKMSVGNRIVDSKHQEIFGMINGIAHSIMEKDIAALSEAFDLLENCLSVYFVVEEHIAKAANFDFTQHRSDHQKLLNDFQRMKGWLIEKNGMWSKFEEKGCIESLNNCLIQHIKEDAKPLKAVLDTHFYDFKP